MVKKERLGILFIGIYQMISALVILVTLNVQQNPQFNTRFGVPFLPDLLAKIIIGIGSIIVSYGYLRQLKWGFWGMVVESGYFFFVCIIQLIVIDTWKAPIGIIFYHGLVIIYTLLHHKDFGVFNKGEVQIVK